MPRTLPGQMVRGMPVDPETRRVTWLARDGSGYGSTLLGIITAALTGPRFPDRPVAVLFLPLVGLGGGLWLWLRLLLGLRDRLLRLLLSRLGCWLLRPLLPLVRLNWFCHGSSLRMADQSHELLDMSC